jgi:hypothetical protein
VKKRLNLEVKIDVAKTISALTVLIVVLSRL